MTISMKQVQLDHVGAYWYEGNNFHFTALSLSDEFACEYIMDVLIPQTPNTNLTFRHRHTLSSDKIVPIFGTAVQSEKVEMEFEGKQRMFLRSEFVVPLSAPNGRDLDENIVYAEWVKKSYDAGKPVGISHHFQVHKDENGKAYWANMLEIAGTPYPRCPECLNVTPNQTGEVSMNEKDKAKLKSMKPEELQALLETTTLELDTARQQLEDKAKALEEATAKADTLEGELETGKQRLEAAEQDADKAVTMLETLSKEVARMKLDIEYERTKGPLVREILSLEGRPELEDFYKRKDEDYLRAQLERIKQPKPEISGMNPSDAMLQARQKLEDEEPTFDDVVGALAPNLRAQYKELMKRKGGVA